MSLINYVTLSISRTSMPQGHICSIDYSYFLNADKVSYLDNQTFSVSCELCGHDMLHDKHLGEKSYDAHTVTSHASMPVERSFMVQCEILNERIGKDAIYIRLHVRASNGDTFTAKSLVVKDHF